MRERKNHSALYEEICVLFGLSLGILRIGLPQHGGCGSSLSYEQCKHCSTIVLMIVLLTIVKL